MTFTIDFVDTPNGNVPTNLGIEFLQLAQSMPAVYGGQANPSPTYFDIYEGHMRFKYALTGSAPVIVHGQRINIVNRISERDIFATLFLGNPLQYRDTAADQFIAEFFIGYMSKDDEPGTAVVGGGARAEWTPGGGWIDACKVFVGRLGTGTPAIGSYAVPDVDGDNAGELSFWKDLNAISVSKQGSILTADLNGVTIISADIADSLPHYRLVFHVAAYNRTGSVYTPYSVVTGFSGTDDGPPAIFNAPVFESHYHEYASGGIGYYKIPLHDLRKQGFIKQVAPKVWEAVQDLEFTTVQEPAIFACKAGARFITTEVDRDFSQDFHIVRFI